MNSGKEKKKQSKRRVSGVSDGNSETREKLRLIRVKFLRLAHKLGQNSNNAIVAHILYRLWLGEQPTRNSNSIPSETLNFDRESEIAAEQEAAEQEGGLDFSCTILLLGKTGVGKSATINSIFDEVKCSTDAFQLGTKKVQEIVGTIKGIKIRVIDTPGLLTSFTGHHHNKKVLQSVEHFIKKRPPDIVLYIDRLDMQGVDYPDLALLNSITETLSAAVWFNTVVVLTHAASAPPDGPNGTPLSYEMFVAHRLDVLRQDIRQAAGMKKLMNPVSLVENNKSYLTNGQIEKDNFMENFMQKSNSTTNGDIWKRELLLLCFSPKILDEANALLKLQDKNPSGKSSRQLPALPYFFSSLLQSRAQLKMPEPYYFLAVIPMPLSFDSDNPTYRYRDCCLPPLSFPSESPYRVHPNFLPQSPYPWMLVPILETRVWDHDIGYEGVSFEKPSVIGRRQIPVSVSGRVTKENKRPISVDMKCATSWKLGEGKSSLAGLDIQSAGHKLAYTLRSETRFTSFKQHQNTAGLTITSLGNALIAGVKLEDILAMGKCFKLIVNGGAITSGGDAAYGGTVETTFIGKEKGCYPLAAIAILPSTLGLSIICRHGELDFGCNLHSEFQLGRNTIMVAGANLNNRGAGQVRISTTSSKYFQIVLIGVIPILRALQHRWSG